MQMISGLKAEVCYLTMMFVLVTCLSNWLTTFWTGMVKTSVFDYGKPSPKAIDSQRSAYTSAVILEPVRIMITYVRQTEIQKVAVQMSIRQFEDFLWTNLWSKIPCYLRRKKKLPHQRFFYKMVLLSIRNIESFHRCKAQG